MARIERSRVEEVLSEGYDFELGDYIKLGFDEFKEEWLMYSLYGLVACMILMLSFFTVIGFVLLLYPTMLGFAVASDKRNENGKISFSDFFDAYKNFGSHAVISLIVLLAYLILYVPMLLIFGLTTFVFEDFPQLGIFSFFGSFFFIFVAILIVYFVMIGLFFAPYLIHYGGYSGTEAARESFRLVFKNFWWLLLFVIVTGVIGGIGQYLCLVGMFASLAVASLMNYSMIKKVLMTDTHNEIEEIGNANI